MEKTNKVDYRKKNRTIIGFLQWLSNRLIYKHFYSIEDDVIKSIKEVCVLLDEEYKCTIDDKKLDMILAKYYVDFFLDQSEDFKIGFSEDQRQELRMMIRNIVNDILNNRVPKESLIKKE